MRHPPVRGWNSSTLNHPYSIGFFWAKQNFSPKVAAWHPCSYRKGDEIRNVKDGRVAA
jgi:hypothetical protein